MIIVPLPKDTIETKDGAKLVVLGFTNFKSKGPAVYANDGNASPMVAIYFFDIDKINDVKVEFSSSSKVFTAMGKVRRKIHLPQPNDNVYILSKDADFDSDFDSYENSKRVKVSGFKLHNKKHGLGKGLLIEDEDKNVYRLSEILDIDREIGSDEFSRKTFLRVYKEYRGH